MKIFKLEDWEQTHVNSLTLKMIFAATVATLLTTAIAFLLKKAGIPEIRPELLFAPWGVALVVGISVAFRQGVMAERERVAQSKDSK